MCLYVLPEVEEFCGVRFIYAREMTYAITSTATPVFLVGLQIAASLSASVCPMQVASSLLFPDFLSLWNATLKRQLKIVFCILCVRIPFTVSYLFVSCSTS